MSSSFWENATMGTPTPCLENRPKNLEEEKKATEYPPPPRPPLISFFKPGIDHVMHAMLNPPPPPLEQITL